MDNLIESRYLDEIIKQSNRALFCVRLIDDSLEQNTTEDLFREVEHFVQHASAVSRFLWNSNEKERCSYLREKLKVDDRNILSKNTLRNHLVHFDERLGKWAKNSKCHNIVDQNIGDVSKLVSGIDKIDYIRNYCDESKSYTFCGESFDIQGMVKEINVILKSAKNRSEAISTISKTK